MPQPWAELRSPFGAQAQLFHTEQLTFSDHTKVSTTFEVI
jgi:hypothetical protein